MSEKTTKVEHYSRDCASADLTNFCHLAKEHDIIEVAEWYNGEGHDVCISTSQGMRYIQITCGELAAINALVGVL